MSDEHEDPTWHLPIPNDVGEMEARVEFDAMIRACVDLVDAAYPDIDRAQRWMVLTGAAIGVQVTLGRDLDVIKAKLEEHRREAS